MSELTKINPILPCSHPTTVALIDDDLDFLENLVKALELESKPHVRFQDSQQGIDYLNQDTYRQNFVNRIVEFEEGSVTLDTLVFRDKLILQEALNPKRFSQVSVLVVDYEMPRMRGLEVCASLKNPFIKKIMLTGVADESIAIDAFNKGLIYQYVRKQDPDFDKKILNVIKQAQQEYFEEIFSIPMKILQERPESTALVEPKFVTYFNEIIQKYAIEEYYLVEPTGSFLMVDSNQKTHSLMTLDEGLVETYLYAPEGEHLSESQIQAMEDRKLVPFYYNPFTQPRFSAGMKTIEPYLHAPTVLKGTPETYYCAFGKDSIQMGDQKVEFWNA